MIVVMLASYSFIDGARLILNARDRSCFTLLLNDIPHSTLGPKRGLCINLEEVEMGSVTVFPSPLEKKVTQDPRTKPMPSSWGGTRAKLHHSVKGLQQGDSLESNGERPETPLTRTA
jgi:hypothetical protein